MKYLFFCLMTLLCAVIISCSASEHERDVQFGEGEQIEAGDGRESSPALNNRQDITPGLNNQDELTFLSLREEEKPEEILNWITELRKLDRSPLWSTKESGDSLFIYIGWGQRPSGGYSVEVTGVEEVDETELVVRTAFNAPDPDAIVSQEITHPYELIRISRSGLPVRIETEGNDPPRLMLTVTGIDQMKPIVAGSGSIKLFSPEPGATVSPGFGVTGLASVFEATVNYRILDTDGGVILEHFTTAYESMNWGFFSFAPDSASFSDLDPGEEIYLELFTIDAKDGEEINNFQIPLTISL